MWCAMSVFMAPSTADSALAAVVASYGAIWWRPGPSRAEEFLPVDHGLVDHSLVWTRMSRPLADGTYMTDLCSSSVEVRATGLHRWMWAVERFASYQRKPDVVAQNRLFMNVTMFEDLYAEIDAIVPTLRLCLCPEMSAGWGTVTYRERRAELDVHARKLYEWIELPGGSVICSLAEWQAAAGASFEATMHHRAAWCFKFHGNEQHDVGGSGVSLEDFQRAVRWLGMPEWDTNIIREEGQRVVRARTGGGSVSRGVVDWDEHIVSSGRAGGR